MGTGGQAALAAAVSVVTGLSAIAPAQVTIGRNFSGAALGNVGIIPPDTMGAIGVDHFVQFVNGRFGVYNKASGALNFGSTASDATFWNNAGAVWQSALSDPRIVYDHASGRWFASQLEYLNGVTQVIRQQRPSIAELTAGVAEIAGAVHEAYFSLPGPDLLASIPQQQQQ